MALFTKPTEVVRWADVTPGSSRSEPPSGKKDTGWVFQDTPPAAQQNWLTGVTGDWLAWLNERLGDGATADALEVLDPAGGASIASFAKISGDSVFRLGPDSSATAPRLVADSTGQLLEFFLDNALIAQIESALGIPTMTLAPAGVTGRLTLNATGARVTGNSSGMEFRTIGTDDQFTFVEAGVEVASIERLGSVPVIRVGTGTNAPRFAHETTADELEVYVENALSMVLREAAGGFTELQIGDGATGARLEFGTSDQRITGLGSGLFYDVPTGDTHEFSISGTTHFEVLPDHVIADAFQVPLTDVTDPGANSQVGRRVMNSTISAVVGIDGVGSSSGGNVKSSTENEWNVNTATRTGSTGQYNVVFRRPLPSAEYLVFATSRSSGLGHTFSVSNKATTGFTVSSQAFNAGGGVFNAADLDFDVIVVGGA